jgi:dCMP deaminase
MSWDLRFLDLARKISTWSKDPSTQVGAIAVRNKRILATGYNGFPRGVADLPGRLLDREEKLLRIVHAEANIVAQAAQNGISLDQASIYVWPFLPCSNCCSLLIQSGITKVIAPHIPIPDRWAHNFNLSKSMFSEAKVELILVNVSD